MAAAPHRGPGLAGLSAIRPRLVLLILLAIGPLVALMVAGGLENRHAIVTAAERQLENQARLYAEQQDNVIQEARNLLMVLARIPAVSTAKKDGRNWVRLALRDGTSASLGVAHRA